MAKVFEMNTTPLYIFSIEIINSTPFIPHLHKTL